jgi:hypothetical protein
MRDPARGPPRAGSDEEAEVPAVAGRPRDEVREEAVDARAAHSVARALLAQGQSASAVAKELRRRMGISRNDARRIAHEAVDGLEPPPSSDS